MLAAYICTWPRGLTTEQVMFRDKVIAAVEAAAERAGCTAHVLESRPGRLNFCCSPHDEDAGWAGDLRLQLSRAGIDASLEHSGPIGRLHFATLDMLTAWLERELGDGNGCSDCGQAVSMAGDGWDGRCGDCADRADPL